MKSAAGEASEHRAHTRLRDAVLALSDDPGPDNLASYLAASRAFEECRAASAGRRNSRSEGAGTPRR